MLTVSRRHRIAVAAGALLATAVVPLGWSTGASPARAGDCLYLFTHRDFFGEMACIPSWDRGNLYPPFDNSVSSINNTLFHTTMCVYLDYNTVGYSMAVGPRARYKNLAWDAAPDGGNWNDRISSVGRC
jgi:hypothetical protein